MAVPFGAGDAAEAPALILGDDEAGAARRAAAAGVQAPFGEGETVIVGELLVRGEVATGDDPDVATDDFDAAIRRAGMVDETRDASARTAIDVMTAVEHEDVNRIVTAATLAFEPLGFAAGGLGLGDALAGVLDDRRAVGDGAAGEDTAAVDRGTAVGDERDQRTKGQKDQGTNRS